VDGEIATITLNRPEKRNAQTFATWSELARMGETLPESVRVVVVAGEGPSFSAGLDLALFAGDRGHTGDAGDAGGTAGTEDAEGDAGGGGSFAAAAKADDAALERMIAEAQRGFLWLRRPEIVSIAAVQGHAIGAGFQLALACDLCVMADDAKLCMKEPALGLVPDLTGTKPLADLVGVPRAIEICLTARTVGAAEAYQLGLAELVVPRDELSQAVRDLTAALLSVNRDAATATKRLLQDAPGRTLEEQAAAERAAQAIRLRALFAAG